MVIVFLSRLILGEDLVPRNDDFSTEVCEFHVQAIGTLALVPSCEYSYEQKCRKLKSHHRGSPPRPCRRSGPYARCSMAKSYTSKTTSLTLEHAEISIWSLLTSFSRLISRH